MSVQDEINLFCGYFQGQITAIQLLSLKEDQELDRTQNQLRFYKKVLLATAVDTLAGIRFPKQRYPQLYRKNQERFVHFLKESGCWADGCYVSIPFLAEHLSGGKIAKGKLREFIEKKMTTAHTKGKFSLKFSDIDEPIERVLALATNEQEESVIIENQHYELMYRYRNYLVHESREPGTTMEISEHAKEPYYHGYLGEKKLYLAYPMGLFLSIVEQSVAYLKSYLEKHNLNPYDFVEETSRW